jgi:hypothetical protein
MTPQRDQFSGVKVCRAPWAQFKPSWLSVLTIVSDDQRQSPRQHKVWKRDLDGFDGMQRLA